MAHLGAAVLSPLLTTYLAQQDNLRRLLRARLGNEDEAEDLLQELYLRLTRAAAPDDIQNPAGYLFRTALNLARDHRRERQRSQARDGHWVAATQTTAGTEQVAEIPAADAAYEAKQRLASLMAALDELSMHARRVFVLHKVEGLSYAEVAARLGVSRSTVEKHMTTALKHFVARLGNG